MSQRERYEFLVARDGADAALRFVRETRVAYRKAVRDPVRYTMYRRPLIEAYVELGRIVRERLVK